MIFTRRPRTSFLIAASVALLALWILRNPGSQQNEELTEETISTDVIADNPAVTQQPAADKAEAAQARQEIVRQNTKVQLLEQILTSQNDNDPRLDTELRVLSKKDRQDLQAYYKHLPAEDRNARGTTIFLLSRNLEDGDDFQFVTSVLSEEPCLSLTDCSMAEDPAMAHVDEHDSSQAVTLVYPQLVALKGLERAVGSEVLRKQFGGEIQTALKRAQTHPDPRVRNLASALAQGMRN